VIEAIPFDRGGKERAPAFTIILSLADSLKARVIR
jgi:hypothetical protein